VCQLKHARFEHFDFVPREALAIAVQVESNSFWQMLIATLEQPRGEASISIGKQADNVALISKEMKRPDCRPAIALGVYFIYAWSAIAVAVGWTPLADDALSHERHPLFNYGSFHHHHRPRRQASKAVIELKTKNPLPITGGLCYGLLQLTAHTTPHHDNLLGTFASGIIPCSVTA